MRWNFVLEQLVVLASPLFLARASRKKKPPKSKVRRKPSKPAKRAKVRAARKKMAPKPPRGKRLPVKPSRKSQLKTKAAPVAPKKVVAEEEPLPPPVAPIGRAILLVPKEGTYVESPHPTFRWLSVGGSTRYEVQWGEDPVLATKYLTISLATEATVPVEKPLRVGAMYYWRVRGGNDAGWGPWSPISSFRVLEETT